VPKNQETITTPPPPRALRTVKGARLALARLYHQVNRGEVDPAIAGRLTAILCALLASARDHDFDARITELEKLFGKPKSNGHARPELRP
jgi:hypothetical protein